MIYLAAPYSHPDNEVILKRMEQVYAAMHQLMSEGRHVTSPLFAHELASRFDMPTTYDFWERYCLDILGRCDEMFVLTLDGWKESRGIKGEIEFCGAINIPIKYLGLSQIIRYNDGSLGGDCGR